MHHPERVGSMSGKGRPDRDDLGYHPIRMCAVPTSVLASFLSCCTFAAPWFGPPVSGFRLPLAFLHK